MTEEQPKRILISRLSAIGDTLHSLPLAAALKDLYPDCFLGWVVEMPSAPLILGNPLVDWTYVLPKGWLKSPLLVWNLRQKLREQRFDLAFDIQGLSKSAVAARLSGAKTRVGFTRGEAREIAPALDNRLVKPSGQHAIDMTLSLLSGIGAEAPGPARFVLPSCPEPDLRLIDEILGREEFRDGFVVMGPWGSFPAKLWPLDRFRRLAEKIHQETGLRSLMLGHGRKEREMVMETAAKAPEILIPAPDISLMGVAELARRSRLFIGCDSFPMHAAAAVGAPTLGLFGVTDPQRLGPYGPTGRYVFERITLVKSTRERRELGPENMMALGVGKVLDFALRMLLEFG